MMGRVKGLGFLDFFRGSFNSKKKLPENFTAPKTGKEAFPDRLENT